MASLAFHLGRASNFVSHSIALGGALARNDLNVLLAAEGIECHLNGLYITAGRQLVDNHTRIEHLKPHSSSREVYKGILDGASSAVFNGKIFVAQDAQKTDAKQSNKNLLLSTEAIVNTNPELEIFADDVKCTHGATIGHLDQDALFYLRSRGLDVETARGMLTYGFAIEIINCIKTAAVRDALSARLFPGFPGRESLRVEP
jgi:Fe-S cluster assembly protein SufD